MRKACANRTKHFHIRPGEHTLTDMAQLALPKRLPSLLLLALTPISLYASSLSTLTVPTISADESVRIVSVSGTTDVGAAITSADASLGSRPGSIRVASGRVVSTPPKLSNGHFLFLDVPLTWTTGFPLAARASDQEIQCAGLQIFSFTAGPGSWLSMTNASNVRLRNCRMKAAAPGYTAVVATTTHTLTLDGNSMLNGSLVQIVSSAPNYAAVTSATMSSNITISNNRLDNTSSPNTGTGVLILYTDTGNITDNQFSNVNTGIEWWGGDSCVGQCTNGGDGASGNSRKLTRLSIQNNIISSSNACIWGSMGQGIDVGLNACTGNHTGDVGLDAEGSLDVRFHGGSVTGYPNGDLASFWLSDRITFDGIQVTSSGEPVFHIFNATNAGGGRTITFAHNTFNCRGKTFCGTGFDAVENLILDGNHWYSAALSGGFNSTRVVITNNDWHILLPMPSVIQVAGLTHGSSANGNVLIQNNTIQSLAAQAADARAIHVDLGDPNAPTTTTISGNTIRGKSSQFAYPITIECDGSTPNSAAQSNTCTITGNSVDALGGIVTRVTNRAAPRVTNSGNTTNPL